MARDHIGSQNFLQRPVEGLATLRAQGPIVKSRLPFLGQVWLTTTHAATQSVLKRDTDFRMTRPGGRPAGLAWWMPPSVRILADNMIGHDGAAHKRLRSRVDRAFAKRGIEAMEPMVGTMADRLMDQIDPRSEIDLVTHYARIFPAEVIADLLGVSRERRDGFLKLATGFTDTSSPLRMTLSIMGVGRFVRFVRDMIRDAESTGQDGLINQLLDDDDPLNEAELISMVFLLMFAGFETTTNLIAGSVLALERHPEAKQDWLSDPHPRGIEELVRHVSAVSGTKPRFVRQDTVVEGADLPEGAMIMALPIAANYDPDVYDRPETLQMDRLPNPHLGFGAGPHFCLGNQLARMELRVALQKLYDRFPNLRITAPNPVYHTRPGHRALRTLPVRLHP